MAEARWTTWLGWLNPLRAGGPIFIKEVRTSSRRRRTYALRAGYLAALAVFTVAVWTQAVPDWAQSGGAAADAAAVAQMADAGKAVVHSVLVFNFLALQAVVVVLLSGSFSGEVQRQTLWSLLSTPVSEFQIVAGKLGAGVLQTLGLLLCSLPVLGVVRVMGGVEWGQVLSATAVTFCSILLTGSIAVCFSTMIRQALAVMLVSLLAAAAYSAICWIVLVLALHWLVLALLTRRLNANRGPSLARSLGQAALSLLAVLTFIPMLGVAIYLTVGAPQYASPFLAVIDPAGGSWVATATVCLLQLGAAGVILARSRRGIELARTGILFGQEAVDQTRSQQATAELLSLPALERARQQGQAQAPVRPGADGVEPVRPVEPAPPPRLDASPSRSYTRLGSPIVWKDCYGPLLRSEGLQIFLVVLPLTVGLGLYVGTLLEGKFAHIEAHLHGVVYPILAAGLLLTTVLAATSVSHERQTRMWPALLTTGLSDGHIFWAKSAAVAWRCRFLWLALALHLAAFTAAGVLHPVSLPLVLALAASLHLFLTSLGAYLGTRIASTTPALLTMLGLAGGAWIVLPLLLAPLHYSSVAGLHEGTQFLQQFHPAWLADLAVRGVEPFHATRYQGLFEVGRQYGQAALLTLPPILGYAAAGGVLGWLACRRFRACAF